MKPIKVFLENINVLNFLLLATAAFLLFDLNDSSIDKKIKFTNFKPKEVLIDTEEKVAVEKTAAYLDYAAIVEKNLFHPKRTMISGKEEEQQITRPEIILYGTLMTDNKKVAYIEDKKNPYSTPGRGKRQVVVTEGDMIAGYKLEKVNAESILLVRGEDKIIVTLSTQKERKSGEVTAKTASPGPGPVPDSRAVQAPSAFQPQIKPMQSGMPPPPPLPVRSPKFNPR
jgi:hypothetical protein